MSERNPYLWTSDVPRHFVQRSALAERVQARLREGSSVNLIGCRGMGKSSFISRFIGLMAQPDIDVLQIRSPAATRTVARAIQSLCDAMANGAEKRGFRRATQEKMVQHARNEQLRELIEVYLSELERPENRVERLLLVYDELDKYAESTDGSTTAWGRPFLDELEDIRKKLDGHLVILSAGGLSLAALDTMLGSAYFSRAKTEVVESFTFEELWQLAIPLRDRGVGNMDEIIDAIRLATGGIPGIATYVLQQLWKIEKPTPDHVTDAIDSFRNEDLLDHIANAIFVSEAATDAARVWPELYHSGGKLPRKRLLQLIKPQDAHKPAKDKWVFRLLRSSGLIRANEDTHRKPLIEVEIIPSILTIDINTAFGESPSLKDTLREQLVADLVDTLGQIHRMGIDFFDSKNDIVQESVFSAMLAIALRSRGWHVEREAISAAGYADIKARHDRFGETLAVVEVKIWPRNDYKGIHEQVVSYWSTGVDALATVMVADIKDEDWPKTYVTECLEGKTHEHFAKEPVPALAAHFVAKTKQCAVEEVDHFLLRLAKRKTK